MQYCSLIIKNNISRKQIQTINANFFTSFQFEYTR